MDEGKHQHNLKSNWKWIAAIIVAAVVLLSVLAMPSEGSTEQVESDDTKEEKVQQTREQRLQAAIEKLSLTSELGTVEYTITIVHTERKKAIFGQQASLALILKAHLKGGIKMHNFSKNNIIVNEANNSVEVVLPHAELISKSIGDEEVHTYSEYLITLKEMGLEERHQARIEAEESLDSYVSKLRIIEDAENNARDFFKSLLGQIGYSWVSVKFVYS